MQLQKLLKITLNAGRNQIDSSAAYFMENIQHNLVTKPALDILASNHYKKKQTTTVKEMNVTIYQG